MSKEGSGIRRTESFTAHDKLRRSFLELAPLELDCMKALWALGQGTVRDIRERLAVYRPRAYTTIMTVMDRLARKGVVERRKAGRAYLYIPNLSEDAARTHALGRVIEKFFGGSTEALLSQLQGIAPEARTIAQFRLEVPRRLRFPLSIPTVDSRTEVEAPTTPLDETLL